MVVLRWERIDYKSYEKATLYFSMASEVDTLDMYPPWALSEAVSENRTSAYFTFHKVACYQDQELCFKLSKCTLLTLSIYFILSPVS